MKASIITVGDELLIGQVIDTNSAWMGQQLNDIGVTIVEKISISDDYAAIHGALDRTMAKADIVLMTGGLGPTKDDITKKAIADYLGDKMVFHDATWRLIRIMFESRGRSTTEAHYQQCYMPESATLLKNKMGTAPGMLFQVNGKQLISMPGVPYEMKYIMEHGVLPALTDKNGEEAIIHKTIRTVGEGESRLADKIRGVVDSLPPHIKMAYLPSLGQVRLRLTGKGKNKSVLEKEVQGYVDRITSLIPDYVFGFNEETLEKRIGEICLDQGIHIGTAESCTGGLIAHRITSISGSSGYYMGSVVAYDNEVKKQLLHVPQETLDNHGAVSEETVIEMVKGALRALPVDVALSVSGIAGPSGGTADKPVGTIWIACGNKEMVKTLLIKAGKDRSKNIEYASSYALNLLRKFLLGLE